MARIGKRERATAKAVAEAVKGNLANLPALHKAKTLYGITSCADPVRLMVATTHGYRDNLHGRYRPKPSLAMTRPDVENQGKARKR